MLNQDNQSQIVFDIDEWTSRTGNTGPYLMYVSARISSILQEVSQEVSVEEDWGLLRHETETELLMLLRSYSEVLKKSAQEFSPHHICSYLFSFCKCFNRMYKSCSVIKAETQELKMARAGLLLAAQRTLTHGLALLGMPTVKRM